MKIKKILIVGSKGFIGSHLFDFFSAQKGIDVFGCDIVPNDEHDSPLAGCPKGVTSCDASNDTRRFQNRIRYFFIQSKKEPDYGTVFSAHDFSAIINCSGAANVPDSFTSPLNDFTLNTLNVMRMLEAIRLFCPHTLFINLSSAAVYGNPSILPIKEDAPCAPVSPYGMHKLSSEQLCREYRDFFNIKTVSLRIFSAYGNGLKKQIFWDITKKALCDKEIALFGTGRETRDFIHIDDICNAVFAALKAENSAPPILNVANGAQHSVESIAKAVCGALASTKKIVYSEHNRTGDPMFWEADISALSALGYTQSVSLTDGISSYVQWARREIESE